MPTTPDKVVLHPLVLLSVVDHYNRVAKDSRKRVVGILLGDVHKGTVDVTNSFAGTPARAWEGITRGHAQVSAGASSSAAISNPKLSQCRHAWCWQARRMRTEEQVSCACTVLRSALRGR